MTETTPPPPFNESGTTTASRSTTSAAPPASAGSVAPAGKGVGGKARLAMLLSGRGSNMLALAREVREGALQGLADIAVVFSNIPEAPGLQAAAELGLPTACRDSRGRKRAEFDADVVALLREHQPDYIILAGYMRILSPGFIRAFAGRILNIHPADTHQHQGLHAYEWAWENRLPETKITVHLVDEGLDTGPVLAQAPVDLRGADSLVEVERRGLAVEHRFYADTLARLIRGELAPELSPTQSLSSGAASPQEEQPGDEAPSYH